MNLFVKIRQYLVDRTETVSKLEKKINYIFQNKEYLKQAFTHKSINAVPRENYERLEFLGDAVLDIIVSRELMREFPDADEGFLTQRRASLVQKKYLASIGQLLDLLDYIRIENSVDLDVKKIKEKQQANLLKHLLDPCSLMEVLILAENSYLIQFGPIEKKHGSLQIIKVNSLSIAIL